MFENYEGFVRMISLVLLFFESFFMGVEDGDRY